jgi:hypothetical protein
MLLGFSLGNLLDVAKGFWLGELLLEGWIDGV